MLVCRDKGNQHVLLIPGIVAMEVSAGRSSADSGGIVKSDVWTEPRTAIVLADPVTKVRPRTTTRIVGGSLAIGKQALRHRSAKEGPTPGSASEAVVLLEEIRRQ
jgi:hypothetical protein